MRFNRIGKVCFGVGLAIMMSLGVSYADNLENELVQEKANMESEIKKEIVDIAFQAAEKIVAKEIDREKYLNLMSVQDQYVYFKFYEPDLITGFNIYNEPYTIWIPTKEWLDVVNSIITNI